MTNEFLLGGVILSTVVSSAVVAIAATALLSFFLTRIGFYRLVWHRPLVEVSIFCMLMAVASTLPGIGISA